MIKTQKSYETSLLWSGKLFFRMDQSREQMLSIAIQKLITRKIFIPNRWKLQKMSFRMWSTDFEKIIEIVQVFQVPAIQNGSNFLEIVTIKLL
jgi:hypothetical protein